MMAMLGWAIPTGAAPRGVEVNTCGQVFAGSGSLSGDLDCSAFAGDSVTIQGGTLDLQGFTLTSASVAIRCEKSCKVVSDPPGGSITSDGSGTILAVRAFVPAGSPRRHLRVSDVLINDGILSTGNGNIKVFDSTITGVTSNIFGAVDTPSGTARLLRSVVTGNAGTGVNCARARVIDSEVSNNAGLGVHGSVSSSIKRSTISGNGSHGIGLTSRVRVTDSIITGNGLAGINVPASHRTKIKVIGSDISGNIGQGIAGLAQRVTVRDSTINNNGAEGVRQDALGVIKLTGATVTGNVLDGIAQTNTFTDRCDLVLRGSTVTGNGTDASCGVSRTCADLTSCGLPTVSASTCDTSYDVNSGFPGTSWGVCSLD